MPEENKPNTMEQPIDSAKKPNKTWMIISIVLILLIIALVTFGYISMQNQNKGTNTLKSQIADLQAKNKTLEDSLAAKTADKAATAAVAVTKTDQERILAALKSECAQSFGQNAGSTVGADVQSYNIKTITGNYAQANYLCKGANEGPEVILVKYNDNWNVVAYGMGPFLSDTVRSLYNIPASLPKY